VEGSTILAAARSVAARARAASRVVCWGAQLAASTVFGLTVVLGAKAAVRVRVALEVVCWGARLAASMVSGMVIWRKCRVLGAMEAMLAVEALLVAMEATVAMEVLLVAMDYMEAMLAMEALVALAGTAR